MNNPLEIMDALEEHPEIPIIDSDEWQSLRAAIEAQAAELAQARARIGRLEGVLEHLSNPDNYSNPEFEADTLALAAISESPTQSLAAVRAEVLREASELFSGIDHPATEEEDVLSVQRVVSDLLNEADRIEREAKESG